MRVLAAVLFAMLVPFAIYILAAFIAVDMNAFNWPTEGRIIYVLASAVFMAVVAQNTLED